MEKRMMKWGELIISEEMLLLAVALLILIWGFERYRTRFIRSDLLISFLFAGGLLLIIFVPSFFDRIGAVLDIGPRYVVILLLGNLTLLGVILYLATLIQNVKTDLSLLIRKLSIRQAPTTDGDQQSIYVIIPAYNEETTIRSVVESLPEMIRGYLVQPVVVSDGSVDRTAEKARYNDTVVVEHLINQGQGGALKTGFEVAHENNADIVMTMDGDGQHPPEELEHLVSPIIDDKADYVMGSRYKGKDQSDNGIIRRTGIQFFTQLINILTKSEITDCTNGFRAIRGSDLQKLKLTEDRFSAPELIIEARKSGLRIEEIPVTIEKRQSGTTKKPQLGYGFGLIRTIVVVWLR